MHTFPGDVIPIGTGFRVPHQKKTVIQSPGGKMIRFAIHDGRHTDAGIANDSKGNQPGFAQIGFANHFPLGDMVVSHLPRMQGNDATRPFCDQ